jgi:hypothetical protein
MASICTDQYQGIQIEMQSAGEIPRAQIHRVADREDILMGH